MQNNSLKITRPKKKMETSLLWMAGETKTADDIDRFFVVHWLLGFYAAVMRCPISEAKVLRCHEVDRKILSCGWRGIELKW